MHQLFDAEVRQLQLEALDRFITFCGQRDLEWFLCAGSLLGCVRHEGFIPWDDDIDIMMPRASYDRFRRILKYEAEAPFAVTLPGDQSYPLAFAKVSIPGTRVIEDRVILPPTYGVGLDVFPLDSWPDSNGRRATLRIQIRLLRHLVAAHTFDLSRTQNPWARIILRSLRLVTPRTNVSAYAERIDRITRAAGHARGRDAGVIVWGYMETVRAQAFAKSVIGSFEDRAVRLPDGTEEYLTSLYGADFLIPPPPGQRLSGHSYVAYMSD